MSRSMKLTRPGAGRAIAVVGDVYRFLATGEDTGGKYAIWEATVPPGGGPPLHVHTREEEGFYILEGELSFTIDDRTVLLSKGAFVNLPPGVRHCFKNTSARSARLVIVAAPAGIEKMFDEVCVPLADASQPAPPVTPAEIERVLAAAPRYGITIFPPE